MRSPTRPGALSRPFAAASRRSSRTGAASLLGPLVGLALALVPILLAGGARPAPAPAREPEPAARSAGQARGAAAQPAQRFRIVGCRSRGGPYRGGPALREVALGFDDGPAPDTPAFLSMLEREHAIATFFMIGRQVTPAYGAMLHRELRDGDVLGDHTYSHPNLLAGGASAHSQLAEPIAAIRALTGYTPCVFRPPYGAYDAATVAVAHSLGLATVLWNVDPADWAQPGRAAIVRRVLAQVRPGSIVISHDGGGPRGQTLAAYPAIIAGLRARGYRIVTIPDLLRFRPVYVPCVRLCAGLGVPRALLPRDALVERARF